MSDEKDPRKDAKKTNTGADKHGAKNKNASNRHQPDFKEEGKGDK